MTRYQLVYIIFFLLFFVIHYLEGLPPIGGLSFAQLWKIPILIFLLFYNLLSLRKKNVFEKSGYMLSFEYLLGPEMLLNPVKEIISISKNLPFILLFGYWIQAFQSKRETLERILYAFAQFICLSSIPFLFGIMQPLKANRSAESFGIENLTYFSGILGSSHAAASYFCAAIFVLLNGFLLRRFETKISKYYNVFLIVIGLISLFKAYTRTGWLMFLVGLLCFVRLSRITYRQFAITLCSIFIVVGSLFYLYNNNAAFYARIVGRNVYTARANANHIELQGSGRTKFWHNAVSNLWEADNIYYSLFGRGVTQVANDNLRTVGIKVFSHNQFFDSLSQHGVLGIMLLLLFYLFLFNFIRNREGRYKPLCNALFFSNLIFAFFQNEMYFDFAVIFSIAIAILSIEDETQREGELYPNENIDRNIRI